MDSLELTTLLHELIAEQNKCDSELYFEKNTNFDRRDNVIKKILDLNNTYQEKRYPRIDIYYLKIRQKFQACL